jgi:hypothetical protein
MNRQSPTDTPAPQVIVTRIDSHWHAKVPHLDFDRQVRTLYQLDRWVRFTFGPGWIDYRFCTGDRRLDQLVTQAREARREARRMDERARNLTLRVLAAADRSRLSTRDLAVLLAMSHQRVHQLQRDL